MTAEWVGFTDEDICRIRSKDEDVEHSDELPNGLSGTRDYAGHKQFHKPALGLSGKKRKKVIQVASATPKPAVGLQATLCEQRPSNCNSSTSVTTTAVDVPSVGPTACRQGQEQISPHARNVAVLKVNSEENTFEIMDDCPAAGGPAPLDSMIVKEDQVSQTNPENVSLPTHQVAKRQEGLSNSTRVTILEQFELKRKQMEEENAKRKALLSRAIADRKKQTQAEAQKLAKVQEELNRLDSLLSTDVSILRNHIEAASLDFTEAQKRYDKAEKEFVEAKLELFQKMELKEKLTEHLCTIIEQNEIRKAKKLAQLMQQLEMDSLLKECEVNGMGLVLPQLCALSDVSYTSCNTIRPPGGANDCRQEIALGKENGSGSCPCRTGSILDGKVKVKSVQTGEACANQHSNEHNRTLPQPNRLEECHSSYPDAVSSTDAEETGKVDQAASLSLPRLPSVDASNGVCNCDPAAV